MHALQIESKILDPNFIFDKHLYAFFPSCALGASILLLPTLILAAGK